MAEDEPNKLEWDSSADDDIAAERQISGMECLNQFLCPFSAFYFHIFYDDLWMGYCFNNLLDTCKQLGQTTAYNEGHNERHHRQRRGATKSACPPLSIKCISISSRVAK